MVTLDDIAGAVKAAVGAAEGFSTSLPGGLWLERAPDTTAAWPYAVFSLKAEPAELCFEDAYFQNFTVSVRAFSQVNNAVPPATVQQFLNLALATDAGQSALTNTSLRNATERIMAAKIVTAELELDSKLNEGADIQVGALDVVLMAQGDRSVS